jgi:hypothetical protein
LVALVRGVPESEVAGAVARAEQQLREAASYLWGVASRALEAAGLRVDVGGAA